MSIIATAMLMFVSSNKPLCGHHYRQCKNPTRDEIRIKRRKKRECTVRVTKTAFGKYLAFFHLVRSKSCFRTKNSTKFTDSIIIHIYAVICIRLAATSGHQHWRKATFFSFRCYVLSRRAMNTINITTNAKICESFRSNYQL